MKEILQEKNSLGLLQEAVELETLALQTSNLTKRYEYFNKAKSIRKIAKEIEKWETPTRGF